MGELNLVKLQQRWKATQSRTQRIFLVESNIKAAEQIKRHSYGTHIQNGTSVSLWHDMWNGKVRELVS
jgi:hypothetical protein